jgi:hypothetical protein
MSNYISEIANLYLARRGGALFLTAIDYGIIAEWEKQEIPLRIILRSINEVFDNLAQSERKPRIKSIEYFQETVEENFSNWLEMQVGK